MRAGSAVSPFGQGLARTAAALTYLPRTMAIAYMDVGEGREPGAEALTAYAALQQHAPDSCRAAIELIRGSLIIRVIYIDGKTGGSFTAVMNPQLRGFIMEMGYR